MTRSTAPDELWHELRKAACAQLQAAIEYERALFTGDDDHKPYAFLCAATRRREEAIREVVAAEQAKEDA